MWYRTCHFEKKINVLEHKKESKEQKSVTLSFKVACAVHCTTCNQSWFMLNGILHQPNFLYNFLFWKLQFLPPDVSRHNCSRLFSDPPLFSKNYKIMNRRHCLSDNTVVANWTTCFHPLLSLVLCWCSSVPRQCQVSQKNTDNQKSFFWPFQGLSFNLSQTWVHTICFSMVPSTYFLATCPGVEQSVDFNGICSCVILRSTSQVILLHQESSVWLIFLTYFPHSETDQFCVPSWWDIGQWTGCGWSSASHCQCWHRSK